MKNVAIILAGGVGSRMGSSTPKQFLKIAGRMVIEHTIDVFDANSLIDEIAVVVNPAFLDEMADIVRRNTWGKVAKVLKGGAERYYSTLSAIRAYEQVPDLNMIFHDAVRPLVSDAVIGRVVRALDVYNAIDVAVPATDTIIEVDATGEVITNIPDRKRLRRVQTPQAFKLNTIREAYRRALQDPAFASTDDCGVVVRYMPEERVYIVEGDEANMKLTYKEDIPLFEKLLLQRSTIRNNELKINN